MRAVSTLAAVLGLAIFAEAQTDSCVIESESLSFLSPSLPGCGTSAASFAGCCGNMLVDNSQNPETDAICSTAVFDTAYCGDTCDGFEPNATNTITFDFTYTYSSESTCCEKCKCYGDPLCEAFDGTRDQMIECDGRNFTSCKMEQSICRQQRDHVGNRCKWLKGNNNFPWWNSNLEDGSPCQSDYNVSGQLELVMLDVDGLTISTLIGERGVQTDFSITLAGDDEPYTLNSDTCFDYDPRDVGAANAAGAWHIPASASAIPDAWTVSTPNDVEIRWHISDPTLGVFADVICNKAIGAERTRLDIENVTNTQGLSGGDGFCFSGVIDQGQASGTNVDNSVALHFKCLSEQLPDLSNTCKALADDTCYPRTVLGWQQYWCETAELSMTQASVGAATYADMIETCLSDLRAGTEEEQSTTWINYACQMNSNLPYGTSAQDSYVDECVNLLVEEGWYEWAQTARYEGIIPHEYVQSDTCVSNIEDFTTIPEDLDCASGVIVETNQNGEWVPILYFPPDSPPCTDAIIEANGDDFPALFLYTIRLRRCGLEAKCLVADEGTDCEPIPAIDVDLIFGGAVCQSGGETCETCTRNSGDLPPTVCAENEQDSYEVGSCEQCCLTNNFVPGQENQTCRELTVDTPYCDTTDASTSSYCTALRNSRRNAKLTLDFERSSTGEEFCCESCQLWGDPFGQAFDGSREKLIVCDARDEDCFTQESICDTLRDHAGNPCVWNQTVKDLIGSNRGNIGAYGSPCLPDYAQSGENEIVLYEVPNPTYRLSFYTGERSILDQLLLTTSKGSYKLDPVACYSSDPLDGWTTVSGEDVSTALELTYTGAGEDGYGNDERVWAVYEPDMGIFFRVTCVNSQAVTTDYVGGYRLNIEHLIDTDITRDSTSGYCVSGDLLSYGGSYTNNTFAEECEVKDLALDHLSCKAFWSGACTPDQIDLGIESWCETANTDKTVQQCINSISKNTPKKTGNAWINAVCTALLPMKQDTQTDSDFIRDCKELAETTNEPYAIVENYGSAGDRASVSSYCASSVSEYGPREDVDACVAGVSVQYQASDGTWTEIFFIPANNLPCSNTLEIPATNSKFWPLFTRPIRFEQCDVDNSEGACLASENVEATCMSNFGYSLSYTFSYSGSVGCPDA